MRPALEVGGDFYDVFRIGDAARSRRRRCLGQGCGGGVLHGDGADDAARSASLSGSRPPMHRAAQRGALRRNPIDMFVTVFYAELDEPRTRSSILNAGHRGAVLARAVAGPRLLTRTGNPPLGVMPGKIFLLFTLAPGEPLFLYTDGVTEPSTRRASSSVSQRLLEVARRTQASRRES